MVVDDLPTGEIHQGYVGPPSPVVDVVVVGPLTVGEEEGPRLMTQARVLGQVLRLDRFPKLEDAPTLVFGDEESWVSFLET